MQTSRKPNSASPKNNNKNENRFHVASAGAIIRYLEIAQTLHFQLKENSTYRKELNRKKEKEKEKEKETIVSLQPQFLLNYVNSCYRRPFEDQFMGKSGVLNIMKNENEELYLDFLTATLDPKDEIQHLLKSIEFPISNTIILSEIEKLFLEISPNFEDILRSKKIGLSEHELKTISTELLKAYIFAIIGPDFASSTSLSNFLRHIRNAMGRGKPIVDGFYDAIREEMQKYVLRINVGSVTSTFGVRYNALMIGQENAQQIYLEELERKLDTINRAEFDILMKSLGILRDEICNGLSRQSKEEVHFLQSICQIITNHCQVNLSGKKSIFSRSKKEEHQPDLSCTLMVMDSFPKKIKKYKCRYILIFNDRKLYYINKNRTAIIANIGDFDVFNEKFLEMDFKSTKISLSDSQFRDLIKSNGGFTHEEFKIEEIALINSSSVYKTGSISMPVKLGHTPNAMPDTISKIFEKQLKIKKEQMRKAKKENKKNEKRKITIAKKSKSSDTVEPTEKSGNIQHIGDKKVHKKLNRVNSTSDLPIRRKKSADTTNPSKPNEEKMNPLNETENEIQDMRRKYRVPSLFIPKMSDKSDDFQLPPKSNSDDMIQRISHDNDEKLKRNNSDPSRFSPIKVEPLTPRDEKIEKKNKGFFSPRSPRKLSRMWKSEDKFDRTIDNSHTKLPTTLSSDSNECKKSPDVSEPKSPRSGNK